MSALQSIDSVNVSGKSVLIRADLNVPIVDGEVTDRTRLERFAESVRSLVNRGAKVVVMSHLGRPKAADESLSLRRVSYALADCVQMPVAFIEDCVGLIAEKKLRSLPFGSVALLENLRFHPEEEINDRFFALRLSKLGDIYVNDAFSCAHRAHASNHAITEFLPSYAGPSLLEEVGALESALENPRRPVGALVGGAKISSKIAVLEKLVSKMDTVIVVGGMANTFLLAEGHDVGQSLCEPSEVDRAKQIMRLAREVNCNLILPTDGLASTEYKANADFTEVDVAAIPHNTMVLDAGPATTASINKAIDQLSTLLWNGPLGAFEIPPFDRGTQAVAIHVAALTATGKLLSVAGGGDTVAALNATGVADKFTYLSTAGGAFLEWLEGKELPGIAILRQKQTSMEVAI